jgi:hypothetical protein
MCLLGHPQVGRPFIDPAPERKNWFLLSLIFIEL